MERDCVLRIMAAISGTMLLFSGWCAGDDRVTVIDVGSRKQLFIDDRFIETSHGVELTMNPPRRDGQVLLTTDQSEERGRHIGVYSSVLKEDGRVKIWYDLRRYTPGAAYEYELLVGYAESPDGLRFTKPRLGLHEIDNSLENNVVMPNGVGGCSIWIDPRAPPEHRYKNQAKVYPSHKFRMHSSPDGLQWKLFSKIDLPRGGFDTQTIVCWDPNVSRYVMYTRYWVQPDPEPAWFRTVRRLESDDLVHWDTQSIVMEADEVDRATHETPTEQPPVDYYGADVFRYTEAEDVYIMLSQAFWHWQQRDAKGLGPSKFDVRLAVSRDGKTFQRAGGRKPFMATGPEGSFDSRFVWAMPHPIRMDDSLWIYYVGTNRDHDRQIDPAAKGQHLTGISRAVLRLDGYISADADYEGGQITTPPIRFSGKRLELNVETSGGGMVSVEILDQNSRPISGYMRSAAIAVQGNSVRMPVRWQDTEDVSSLAGHPVRLRFHMQDCKLYAFQFRESDAG